MYESQRNSLLWSVSSNTKNSFLFGTMHVGSRETKGLLESLIPYLKGCERYVGESDIGQITDPASYTRMLLPSGHTLQDYLGVNQFSKCRRAIQKNIGLDIVALEMLQPVFIINFIAEKVLENEGREGIDLLLWKKATEMGIPASGLESFAEQMEILQKIKLEDQIQQMKRLCRKVSKLRHQLLIMAEAYRTQQIHKLYRLSTRQMGKMRKLMIHERNFRMAQRILALIDVNAAFISLGAGHLSGEKGVLHILRSKNVQIRPLKIDFS